MERLIENEVDKARVLMASGRKREALECIKRKRMHEMEREKLSTQKLNLMQHEATLHQLKITNLVVEAERAAALSIQREVQRAGDVDGVEKLHDELEELHDTAADVVGATSRPLGAAAALDDDELLDELEQMEVAQMTAELSKVTGINEAQPATALGKQPAPVPSQVPSHVPHAVPLAPPRRLAQPRASKAEEERNERELAALMSSMHVETPMPLPMAAAPLWLELPPDAKANEEREQCNLAAMAASMKMEAPMAMPLPMAACY